VPTPHTIHGRRWRIVADEDVDRLQPDLAPENLHLVVDITDEAHPIPASSFQVEGPHGKRNLEKATMALSIDTPDQHQSKERSFDVR
jgi:hypothetical protein